MADAFDRRWLMFGVQLYFVGVAVLLAVLTAAGMMPPALLLTFTFAVGAGQAMLTWQALITEVVPGTNWRPPPGLTWSALMSLGQLARR